jgi:hypothetical protein
MISIAAQFCSCVQSDFDQLYAAQEKLLRAFDLFPATEKQHLIPAPETACRRCRWRGTVMP